MPNKRARNKARVSFYAPREVKRAAREKLESDGSTLSAYLNGKLGELVATPASEKKPSGK